MDAVTLAEVIFLLVILKLPIAYVAWVIWWAIKAEPVVGTGGERESLSWQPWRRPGGHAPRRGGPHGGPARSAHRPARPQQKVQA
jgi:hypothetical protein